MADVSLPPATRAAKALFGFAVWFLCLLAGTVLAWSSGDPGPMIVVSACFGIAPAVYAARWLGRLFGEP